MKSLLPLMDQHASYQIFLTFQNTFSHPYLDQLGDQFST